MKYILTLLTIILSIVSFAQEVKGTINFAKNSNGYHIIEVTAKGLSEKADQDIYVKSDSLGDFNLKFKNGGRYRLSVSGPFDPDTTFIINVWQNESLKLTIDYPPKICPYEKTKLTGVCPEGNHKDNVAPIVYGMVAGDKEFSRKVERGEVKLGGCLVSDCDPNWYCNIHDRRF